MARKGIREYDAKKFICKELGIDYKGILIKPETDLDTIHTTTPKLIVKPDQLFGKRKKNNLIFSGSLEEVKNWIKEKRNSEVTIGKSKDILTHFLIEPYIEHDNEYYLAFTSEREYDTIIFSEKGGIDIEDNWGNVKKIEVPTLQDIPSFETISNNLTITNFIEKTFNIFRKNGFSYLEFNPFTTTNNNIHLLDCVAKVDSCANSFVNSFPKEFGKRDFPEEKYIEELDKNSGASLKLSILNPQGKIWNILGGGGASIIYLDMITNLGRGDEIANYGENSGNPSKEESYQYAKTILRLMTANNGKILFIVGGIANFTDVRSTFSGYIQALEEHQQELRENNIKIFVRRGGPHEQEGLELMRKIGEKININIQVHGPETSMSEIIQIAKPHI